MNKKALLAGPLVDFVALLVIGLTFMIFFILFRISSDAQNRLQEQGFPELYGNQFLLNYLKTPVQHEGEIMTMIEYLPIVAQDRSILGTFEKVKKYPVIKSTLDSYIEREGGCYFLDAQLGLETVFEFAGSDGKSICNTPQKSSVKPFIIPLNDGKQLQVRLLVSPKVAK